MLGANDGIVSIAGLVVGVATATSNASIVLAAGLAGIVAGALSMAAGEYVSVSSQRDSEKALLAKEAYELKNFPREELKELTAIYVRKGLSEKTAMNVAKELSARDPFRAHVEAELKIDPDDLTNPWHAAFASAAAFVCGALIPLVAVLLPPQPQKIWVTFVSVVLALSITGFLSARVGGAKARKAIARVVAGGILAMTATYFIGRLFNVSV